jgi:hypothetical protein
MNSRVETGLILGVVLGGTTLAGGVVEEGDILLEPVRRWAFGLLCIRKAGRLLTHGGNGAIL